MCVFSSFYHQLWINTWRTTSLARLPSPTSSGYVTSFRALASSKAAPPFLAARGLGVPSARTADTNVVDGQLGSMEQAEAVHNNLETSSVCHEVRPRCKVHVADQHGHDPPACFSAHARCRLQSEALPAQNSHSCTCCAVVATRVEWTATPAATCSEWEGGASDEQEAERLRIESSLPRSGETCERLHTWGRLETTTTLSRCR